MKTAVACIDKPDTQELQSGPLNTYAKRMVFKLLARLKHGELILNDGKEQQIFGCKDERVPKTIAITVLDPSFYTCILLNGAVGAGEAFIKGYWTCEDLTDMIELFICNRTHLEGDLSGIRWLAKPVQFLQRFRKRNTLKGSRRNIEAHYDLGNELFKLFLDETMM